ncbi:rhizoxin biosynthesis, polyketide synthase / nonribosomal peptide synthetase RhiB [Pseudoalteromonas citrea]|uniref:Rhizoxin biosynthesis, polyketide synthase / nonribosomal peptide synthetase RhiB n=2 Tax=Pseudoalteromonas citrea TaxID=43655 RepID=A0AAD4AIS6_9GAMM|nr:non-ribosomal peptide synthetase [Pseudoalteromonas citrea]KAF7771534.1 rhizoxin biosynthesis, polyketide synthase / nonribosomal peptide synthetase RhiB [Pseudoalteromonas citrea]
MKKTHPTPTNNQNSHPQDIAIVGMSLRLPGASTKAQFWHNLNNKVSSITEIPETRWNWRADYDPSPKKDEQKMVSKWGGFIDNIDSFDASFFSISPTEAQSMDPQQRLSLELAWACFEDAGFAPSDFKNSNTGVYLGCSNTDYQEFSTGNIDPHFLTGMSTGVFANRISHYFNFQGPSETVDTACSSSLVAIHKAVNDFKNGEISAALVGGVNLLITKSRYVSFSKLGVLSPKGRCKTLDADADGYVRGEGLGMLLLLPIDKATELNATIYGVIKGSSIGHSGKTNTLTSPNPFSQSRVIQQAHESAGITSDQVSFVELHGTGTKLGDPLEIQGLKRAFRATKAKNASPMPCYLSTVKTNIGHLESAAGIAGVIKVLLSFANKAISPLQNFSTLNPKIALKNSPFKLATESIDWPSDLMQNQSRMAGVSSFGFAGVNAHVILQEPPRQTAESDASAHNECLPTQQMVYVISAKTHQALKQRVLQLSDALKSTPSAELDLRSVTYTLQTGREAMAYRVGFIASSADEALTQLSHYLDDDPASWHEAKIAKATLNSPDKFDMTQSNITLHMLLSAWLAGNIVDWAQLYREEKPRRISLPSYPFSLNSHWISTAQATPPKADMLHPLVHQTMPALDELVFESRFSGNEVFFKEHVVNQQKMLPGVCSLEMALKAICLSHQIENSHTIEFEDVRWIRPVIIDQKHHETEVSLSLWDGEHALSFELYNTSGTAQHCYAKGQVRVVECQNPNSQQPSITTSWPTLGFIEAKDHNGQRVTELTSNGLYQLFSKAGIEYGPSFQGIQRIQRRGNESLALLNIAKRYCHGFYAAPAILDAALQSLAIFSKDDELSLPFAVEQVHFFNVNALTAALNCANNTVKTIWVRACQTQNGSHNTSTHTTQYDIEILDEDGTLYVQFQGFSTRSVKVEPEVAAEPPSSIPPADVTVNRLSHPLNVLKPCWITAEPNTVDNMPQCADIDATIWDYQGPQKYKPEFVHTPFSLADDNTYIADHLIWFAIDQYADPLTLFTYIKSLLANGYGTKRFSITLATYQTQRVHAEPCYAEGAGLIGLLQSIAQEYPLWDIRVCDLPVELFSSQLSHSDCEHVWHAAVSLPTDFHAYRHGQWFKFNIASHHYQQNMLSDAPSSHICNYRQDGVYLVLGGAGGLGQAWSEWMIRHFNAQLIWVGRSDENDTIKHDIAQLAKIGKAPIYFSADAADERAMHAILETIAQSFSQLNGVVHSILHLEDQSIANMDDAQFLRSYQAKQQTSQTLFKVLNNHDVDFLLFFSSLQSFSPAAGQCNYAAGCHYIDSLARANNHKFPIKIVNWGYWGSIGVVQDAYYQQKMAQLGIGSIEVDEGMHALAQFMSSSLLQVGVLKATEQACHQVAKHHSYSTNTPLTAFVQKASAVSYDKEQTTVADDVVLNALCDALHSAGCQSLLDRAIHLSKLPDYFQSWWQETQRYLTDSGLMQAHQVCQSNKDTTDIPINNALLDTCLSHLPDILQGHKKPTDVLFPNGSLSLVESVYKNNQQADYANRVLVEQLTRYLTQLAAPSVKILEIGAGTGGTTAAVLPHLAPWSIEEYAYTDLSQAFFNHAQAQFKTTYPYVTTKYFDVSKPLNVQKAPQSIEIASYDVVIATNVLHATANIRATLQNAKACLKPGGIILINEVVEKSLFTQLTFGLLEGWWLSQDSTLRISGSPMLSLSRWQAVLEEEGFINVTTPAAPHSAQHIICAQSDGNILQKIIHTPQNICNADINTRSTTTTDHAHSVPSKHDASITMNLNHTLTDTLTYTQHTLFTIASKALNIPEDELDLDESFADYGVDSILAIQMLDDINETFALSLPATLLFDYPSISTLSNYIATEHHTHLAQFIKSAKNDTAHVSNTEINTEQVQHKPDTSAQSSVNTSASTKRRFRKPDDSAVSHSSGKNAAPVANNTDTAQKVAIIGMSGQFGSASNLEEFWTMIQEQRTSVVEQQRWDLHTLSEPAQSWCRYASLLDDISSFDAAFFSITPQEAMYMDPQQRLFLQECYKALDDANMANSVSGKNVGVYLGCAQGDYASLAPDDAPAQVFWGNAGSVIPARVSYFLNLKGPAIAVDTACSSSLVSIHMACQALLNNDISCALVGGVATLCTSQFSNHAGKAGMLSPDGTCYTFDDRANGFVPGEGVGVLVLKRLDDALRDNDHVYGVILGSATNQDGTTSGITAPSSVSQEQLHRDVYHRFNISPETIGMVEAHGTGTKLGDPIEFQALTRAFRQHTDLNDFCALGSVKTNIGHCLTAAGVAGVIKALLAIKHKSIPASRNFNVGNAHINWQDSPFFVNTQTKAWHVEPGKQRRAAISSFGFSGTNAHLVIEEFTAPVTSAVQSSNDKALITLSAKSPTALLAKANQLKQWLYTTPEHQHSCTDIAYTLHNAREQMEYRMGFVASTAEQISTQLQLFINKSRGEWKKGEVKQGKNILSALDERDFTRWAYEQDYTKLLSLWVVGAVIDWPLLYNNDCDTNEFYKKGIEPRTLKLPVYPFDNESHWIPAEKLPTAATNKPSLIARNKTGTPSFDSLTHATDFANASHSHNQIINAHQADESSKLLHYLPQWETTAIDDRTAQCSSQPDTHHVVTIGTFNVSALTPSNLNSKAEVVIHSLLANSALAQAQTQVSPPFEQTQLEAYALALLSYLHPLMMSKRPALVQLIIRSSAQLDKQHLLALAGMLKTAALECSYITTQLIQFDDSMSDDQEINALKQEAVLYPNNHRVIRYKLQQRAVLSYIDAQSVEGQLTAHVNPAELPWKDHGVYIITGGLGHIGKAFTKEILEKSTYSKVILIGTKPASTTIDRQLSQLQNEFAQGASRLDYYAMDISQHEQVSALFNTLMQRYGQITGIIHSAGVIKDSLITRKTPAELKHVFAPKIAGLVALDEASKALDLDFFVSFSSIASVFGNLGQADYATANAFIDQYMAERHAQVCQGTRHGLSLCINWPLWDQGGGMQVDAATKTILQRQGMSLMSCELGIDAFYRALALGVTMPQHCFLFGKPTQLTRLWEMNTSTSAASQSSSYAVAKDTNSTLKSASEIMQYLKKVVSEVTKIPCDELDEQENFREIGFDSIMLLSITQTIEAEQFLNVDALPPALLFELETLEDLQHYLLDNQTPCAPQAPLSIADNQIESTVTALSKSQQGLWLLHKQKPDLTAYNVPLVFDVSNINLHNMQHALDFVCQNNPVLQVTMSEVDGIPRQEFANHGIQIAVHTTTFNTKSALTDAIQAYIDQPFTMDNTLLLRAMHFSVTLDEKPLELMAFVFHHVIIDGSSATIFFEQLMQAYNTLQSGRTLLPAGSDYGFFKFVEWENTMLKGQEGQALKQFWQKELQGLLPVLKLQSTQYPTPDSHSLNRHNERLHSESGRIDVAISAITEQQIKQSVKHTGISASVFFLSVFQMILSRFSGKSHTNTDSTNTHEIIVGIPVLNRPQLSMSKSLGLFANQLPLRNTLNTSASFSELAISNQQKLNCIMGHSALPFSEIINALNSPRNTEHHPIFQVGYAYHNFVAQSWFANNANLADSVWGEFQQAPELDLSLEVTPLPEQFRVTFKFNEHAYSSSFITTLAKEYVSLINDVLSSPTVPMHDVMTTNHTQNQASTNLTSAIALSTAESPPLNTVRTNTPPSILDMFNAHLGEAANNCALVYGDHTLSYASLNQRSDALASYLLSLDEVKNHQGETLLIGVCAKPSLDLIIAILAILKSGAAYLPIDPHSAQERASFILQDAQPALLLLDTALSSWHQGLLTTHASALSIYALDDCLNHSSAYSQVNNTLAVRKAIHACDLAYVIYTSGSTGEPKGVLVEHGNVTQLFINSQTLFQFSEQDTWCLFHSYAFDFSVWEIWGALLHGGKLVIPDEATKKDSAAFSHFIAEHEVTVLNQTPSAFFPLMERLVANPQLAHHIRQIIFGGEALELHRLVPWFASDYARPELVNMYGITETTIHVTHASITKSMVMNSQNKSIIGLPLPGYDILLFDEHRHAVSHGNIGEMYVAGTGVTRGYLNRTALTEERFINHIDESGVQRRLYRTGDLAKRASDGRLEYIGRTDNQVQIRGHRIELGEVHHALLTLSYVNDAAVIVQNKHQGDVLTAYVVTKTSVSIETLRTDLLALLPEYMVPSFFIFIEKLPLTANGKLDKKALEQQTFRTKSDHANAAVTHQDSAILRTTLPLLSVSQLQASITKLWLQTLEIEHVGLDEPFFEAGGNSLLANVLSAKFLSVLNIEFSITQIFQYSTIRAMAEHLANQPADSHTTQQNNASPDHGISAAQPTLIQDSAHTASRYPEYYHESVAIIGMSCQYSMSANHHEFWQNLIQGKDLLKRIAYADEHKPVTWLDSWVDGQDMFDPAFFNISDKNAKTMSYSQRQLLLHAWKAIEDAGYRCEQIPKTGVYISASNTDTPNLNLHDKIKDGQFILNAQDYVSSTLNQPGTLPTTISYHLGFTGPSLFVHSNCSSSMSAIALACTALKAKEIDYAIVGAACLYPQRETGYHYEKGMNFAKDARCKVFDENADGMIGGNGVSLIVLKRANEAVDDADHIYSVIRGIKVNNDGKDKAGFFAPGNTGQMSVIEQTLESANIHPETISYVEAHGTGTALGDPIEFAALQQVYQKHTNKKQFCGLGAVKSNLGHTDTLAGLTGLIKTSLSLYYKQLPASLHYTTPNPHINLADSPFYVVDKQQAWSSEHLPRRAAVSSFGIGGTNAHAILEEYTPLNMSDDVHEKASFPQSTSPEGLYIVVLSAQSADVLTLQVQLLLEHLSVNQYEKSQLKNIAYTLQTGRTTMAHRTGFVVSSLSQLCTELQVYLASAASLCKQLTKEAVPATAESTASPVQQQTYLATCLSNQQYHEILQRWIDTGFINWDFLYQDSDFNNASSITKLSLPTYPFDLKQYSLWGMENSGGTKAASAAITAELTKPTFSPSCKTTQETNPPQLTIEVPHWVDKSLNQVSITQSQAHTQAQHHVIFCDVPEVSLPNATSYSLFSNHYGIEHKIEDYGYQLVDIIKQLITLKQPISLQLVLNDTYGANNEPSQANAYFCFHSLLKTASLETPSLKTQVVLFDNTTNSDTLTTRLMNDKHHNEAVIRYIDNNRQILAYKPLDTHQHELTQPCDNMSWQPGGVYLITGGLGGIGAHFIADLNRIEQHKTVIATGRKPLEHPDVQAQLTKLACANTTLKYVQVDVSKKMAVILLIRDIITEFDTLTGVIHAAGVLNDTLLTKKDKSTFSKVLAPKVKGVIALDEATQDIPLDFLVCFSGLSGVNGAISQVDYATANAFLDSYMHYRDTLVSKGLRSGKSCSIDWPYWQHGGMKINPQFATQLTQLGITPMPTKIGIAAFKHSLHQVQTLVDYKAQISQDNTQQHLASSSRFQSKAHLHTHLEEFLLTSTASLLGTDPDSIDLDSDLGDLGADSIVFISFINQVNKQYQLDISPSVLFTHSTLNSIKVHIIETYETQLIALNNDVNDTQKSTQSLQPDPENQSAQAVSKDPIAIIGMSCEFPQAKNPHAFWHNLSQGKDSVTPYVWPQESNPCPEPLPDEVNWLGQLDKTEHFDPLFFNIAPAESNRIGRQESMLMMHVWKCIEDAGYDPTALAGSNTGIFIGCQSNYHDGMLTSSAFAPNRMSYFLDLHGPSEGVDTTCSSSLVAIHKAVQAIEQGDCDQAIVGGVNIIDTPHASLAMHDIGALSPTGRCRPFSDDADGIVRGEGIGMLFLKKRSACQQDNDCIYGTILGSAVNHGGKSHGFTVPNANAQSRLLTKAWQNAEIDPSSISYIECHGTGTSLGDPVEIDALKQAYAAANNDPSGEKRCALGSVKSNVGHLEIAAGIAGVIKVLLQFKHKTLAPSLHVKALNPYLSLDDTPFTVQTTLTDWQSQQQRRAAVSSFGISGVNAHLVLEEHHTDDPCNDLNSPSSNRHNKAVDPIKLCTTGDASIVLLSANTDTQLQAQIIELKSFLSDPTNSDLDTPHQLARLAYTLQVGRTHQKYRAAWVVSSMAELISSLANAEQEICSGRFKASTVNKANKATLSNDDVQSLKLSNNLPALAKFWLDSKDVCWNTFNSDTSSVVHKMHLPTTSFIDATHLEQGLAKTILEKARCPNDEENSTLKNEKTPWLVLENNWVSAPLVNSELASPSDLAPLLDKRVLIVSHERKSQYALLDTLPSSMRDSVNSVLFSDFNNDNKGHIFTSDNRPDIVFFIADSVPVPNVSSQQLDCSALSDATAQIAPLYQFIKAIEAFDKDAIQLFYATFSDNDSVSRHDITALLRSYSLRNTLHQWTTVEFINSAASSEKNTPKTWQTQLLQEGCALKLANGEAHQYNHVKYLQGTRFGAQIEKTSLSKCERNSASSNEPIQFKHHGVYLIAGALGELGQQLSEQLLTQYNATLILLGRSSAEHNKAAIAKLSALPGKIHYFPCDVSNEDDMTQVKRDIDALKLQSQSQSLNGIFHLGTAFSEHENTWQDFEQALSVKVDGSQVLDRVFYNTPLDFFVMFSSMAVFGSLNHLSYSYGNGFQNAFASARDTAVEQGHRHGKTLAINWGYWHSNNPVKSIENEFAIKKGYSLIRMENAFAALPSLLASAQSTLCVMSCHNSDKIYHNTLSHLKRAHKQSIGAITNSEILSPSSQHSIAEVVINIVGNVIGVKPNELDLECDLYDYGFDSISLLKTFQQLKTQLSMDIQADAFKNMNTIQALITEIELLAEQQSNTDLLVQTPQHHLPEKPKQLPDFILDAGFTLSEPPSGLSHAYDGDVKVALLTGATGFLGCHILSQLMDTTQAKVYCLVRAPSLKKAQKRIQDAAANYQLKIDMRRIVPVLGDMEHPQLGLSKKNWLKLCAEVEHIIHTASYVNHIQPYFAFKKSVAGTNELLTMATSHTLKMMHFVSSTTASTQVKNSHFSVNPIEDFINTDDASLICSGYGQSKWVQEENIRQASEYGVPYTIYRFSEISGSSTTGIGNTDDIFHRILRMMLSVPVRAQDMSYMLDIIPVDKAAQSIVFGMADKNKRNTMFNVANQTPLTIDKFYQYAEQHQLCFTTENKTAFIHACEGYANKLTDEHDRIIMEGLLSCRPGYDEYLFETYLMPMTPYHKDNFNAFIAEYGIELGDWAPLFDTYFNQWRIDKHNKVLWDYTDKDLDKES